MAKEKKVKFDGIVEAVHYLPDGRVDWVRTYLRRGATFSDYIILNRQSLIEQIKAGKKFMVGERVSQMASTFQVTQPVRVVQKDGQEILATGELQADQDRLEGVPRL
jgi:hypothetical protein